MQKQNKGYQNQLKCLKKIDIRISISIILKRGLITDFRHESLVRASEVTNVVHDLWKNDVNRVAYWSHRSPEMPKLHLS